jgi:uncharacterized protein
LDNSPFFLTRKGAYLRVRLTPKARRTHIAGPAKNAEGETVLKAAVSDAPEDGKANAALIKLLAKEWGFAKSRLKIIKGATNRCKVVSIEGHPDALLEELNRWLEAYHE